MKRREFEIKIEMRSYLYKLHENVNKNATLQLIHTNGCNYSVLFHWRRSILMAFSLPIFNSSSGFMITSCIFKCVVNLNRRNMYDNAIFNDAHAYRVPIQFRGPALL